MNAKERWVTILGLAGTFLLPWPGEAERYGEPSRDRGAVSACARGCAERVPAKWTADGDCRRTHIVSSARAAQFAARR